MDATRAAYNGRLMSSFYSTIERAPARVHAVEGTDKRKREKEREKREREKGVGEKEKRKGEKEGEEEVTKDRLIDGP